MQIRYRAPAGLQVPRDGTGTGFKWRFNNILSSMNWQCTPPTVGTKRLYSPTPSHPGSVEEMETVRHLVFVSAGANSWLVDRTQALELNALVRFPA